MSSQPTGDTERPAVSASQAGGAAPAQSKAATRASAATSGTNAAPETAASAGTSGDARDTTASDGLAPGTADAAGPGMAGADAADAATADAGCTTIVLDPETGPPDPETGPVESGPGPGEPTAGLTAGPVSKLAVAALITGVLALVPIAVACGIAALIGIRRTGRRGHGMATAALFASAAWVIIGGAVGAVGALTHGFHKPVTIKYHESAVFKLREGDCVTMASGQEVSVLSCSAPHEAEVFATFSLPASAWPGTAAIRKEASSGCESRLTGYLNPQLAISLAQSYVFPDKVAWTAGTRTVICEVRAASGELTGSVRGAS